MGSILFSLIISIQKGSSWVFFLKSSVFLTLFFPSQTSIHNLGNFAPSSVFRKGHRRNTGRDNPCKTQEFRFPAAGNLGFGRAGAFLRGKDPGGCRSREFLLMCRNRAIPSRDRDTPSRDRDRDITELMCFWVSLTRFTSGRSGMGVPLPMLSLYFTCKAHSLGKEKHCQESFQRLRKSFVLILWKV